MKISCGISHTGTVFSCCGYSDGHCTDPSAQTLSYSLPLGKQKAFHLQKLRLLELPMVLEGINIVYARDKKSDLVLKPKPDVNRSPKQGPSVALQNKPLTKLTLANCWTF